MVSLAGIDVVKSDISLSGRVIAHFPELMNEGQIINDELAALGSMAKTPECNIIKLPNISASLPQLNECIDELRAKGFNVPLYPSGDSAEEKKIRDTYAKVLGSAVNPVLREGNSDRRVAAPVKSFAQKNPHKMGQWPKESKTEVVFMSEGDFYSSEKSHVMDSEGDVKIELFTANGTKMMKESTPLTKGEVIDASRMSAKHLKQFFKDQIQDAKEKDVLLSLHLKATMMKISDPVMFGYCCEAFFEDALKKHADTFASLKVNLQNGIGDVYDKIKSLPADQKAAIEADLAACYDNKPRLSMVDSGRGITNLHVPSDVIVDASMPCVIRDSGMMWNKDDKLEDTKAMIPDRCYAPFYQEIIKFVQEHGQFDVSTMGNVANVGLMAQKAEEYGSHDKTFILKEAGTMKVTNKATGEVIFEHDVEEGDIWRMAQTKDLPIRDWVKLAVRRASASGSQTIFWLDENRAHDRSMIVKVNEYLKDHDTTGLDISIQPPVQAVRTSMNNAIAGRDTISVTGNVLRDYLTDMFPILELGTSAKMLSIVPLLNGGGMFETGAGGSAPKHVQQFVKEGHLRWDSLGEYLAMAVSLEHMSESTGNARAKLLGDNLNRAIGRLLDNNKSPSRKVGELDNRASNFYLGLYWAEFMAETDPAYKELAESLKANRSKIVGELAACQGVKQDIGGYFKLDDAKAEKAMRPSSTLNAILDN
jgi:isocitrate dehydrogenase